ncbi:calcium-binding protein [Lyngbya sp. PCC 8106]|uniref:calcium-binding protein n=1 Tax=Lyngbya sp. (strain PCC 8106) TaxID=313612 RepID=UPI0000EAA3C5|nr:calcium-binding protein [Lyngbya sp. PCC 8106]EAW37752.1 putative secreted calcium-binding protein [Lyngbya sp. PCC 8106]
MLTIISLPNGEIQNPDGTLSLFPPDGVQGVGRSVELRGSGVFIGTASIDTIFSFDEGSKIVFGLEDSDEFTGFGLGTTLFYGGSGDDNFTGGFGDDTVYGGVGVEALRGGDGNDLLFGQTAGDSIDGQMGNDTILGGEGDDFIRDESLPLEINLLYGGQGDDNLTAGAGNDSIWGDQGNDNLQAGAGVDVLTGGSGFDVLIGGDLGIPPEGGAPSFPGDDTPDEFVLEVQSDISFDLISDFEDGIDKFMLPEGISFDDLAIAELSTDADILNQISELPWINAPTDVGIRLAQTGQLLAVLNGNIGDNPAIPVLASNQIDAEDFV